MAMNMFRRLWSAPMRLWSDEKPIEDEVLYALAVKVADIAMKNNSAVREAAKECGVTLDFVNVDGLDHGFTKGMRYSYVAVVIGYSEENRNQSKDFSLDWLFNTVLEKFCVSEELELFVEGM